MSAINDNINNNCDHNTAGEMLIQYFKSKGFEDDSKTQQIDINFGPNQIREIQTSAGDKFLHLKRIVQAIYKMALYTENRSMNISDNLIGQRLNMVNGDTIEIGRNKKYPFPTEFFLNRKVASLVNNREVKELKTSWIQGSSKLNETKPVKLEIQTNLVLYTNMIFIKTIE